MVVTLEWSATGIGTIGSTPGYPNNVTINTGSVDIGNGSGTQRALAGNLTINNGATANLNALNALFTIGGNLTTNSTGVMNMGTTTGLVVIDGSVFNNGTLTLSTTNNADLHVKANFINSGTLNHNNRTIVLNGTNQQLVGGFGNNTFYNLTVNNPQEQVCHNLS
jgi:hypothetical protein